VSAPTWTPRRRHRQLHCGDMLWGLATRTTSVKQLPLLPRLLRQRLPQTSLQSKWTMGGQLSLPCRMRPPSPKAPTPPAEAAGPLHADAAVAAEFAAARPLDARADAAVAAEFEGAAVSVPSDAQAQKQHAPAARVEGAEEEEGAVEAVEEEEGGAGKRELASLAEAAQRSRRDLEAATAATQQRYAALAALDEAGGAAAAAPWRRRTQRRSGGATQLAAL